MPDIAGAVSDLESNAAVDTLTLARELEADGADVVHMSAGEPDLTTPPHIIEAAKTALEEGYTHYATPQGVPELRAAIARKLRSENDLPVTDEEIVVTMGGKQAIFETLFAVLDPGDTVVVPTPAYLSYEPMVGMFGGDLRHVETDAADGFVPDPDDLAAAISDDVAAVIVNTPSNPTGAVYPEETLAAVRDLAIDHDCWVISDEIYEKLLFEGRHHSIGAMEGMAERTITVNGFSKAYAMTGWRLGYAAGPHRVIDRVTKVHTNSVTCSNTFVQHAGIAALSERAEYVPEIRSLYESRRDALVDAFAAVGVTVPDPHGALYAFVPVGGDSVDFCRRMLEDHHVAAVPGVAFGMDGYVRFSYTTDVDRIREGIDRIAGMFE